MNSDIRILRGLSIATMVFSILGVLAGGAFLALMISASSMLSDPAFYDLFVQELQSGSSGSAAFDGSSPAATYDYSSMNEEQIREAATLGINVVIALAVGYMLLHVVGIVASSMSLRALAAPEKLRRAFGWTVAAAVCAAVVFSVITCVCFIIAAWMNARVRKSFAAFAQGGYPGPGMYQGTMPGQGAGYNQGMYGQGTGSVPPQQQITMQPAQPQQPVQPQQPMPAQPAQPQQPVQPQPAQPVQQPAQPQQPSPAQPVQPAQPIQQPSNQSMSEAQPQGGQGDSVQPQGQPVDSAQAQDAQDNSASKETK